MFHAVHSQLGQSAIVKVFDRDRAEEVQAELRALRLVGAPHAPGLLDAGELPDQLGGHAYAVMQHVPGKTLAYVLRTQRRLTNLSAIRLGLNLLACVHATHKQGIAHGDIKPDNVLVVSGVAGVDRTALIDFGSAQSLGKTPAVSGTRTRTTPEYTAPEVMKHRIITSASDLFSVGCVLFECLAGVRLDVGRLSSAASQAEVLRRTVPIHEGLAAVVERALHVDPTQRFESAAEFRNALLALDASEVAELSVGRWDSAVGPQETLDTVDISEPVSRQQAVDDRPWTISRTELLSTKEPEVWALLGDPGMDRVDVRSGLGELRERWNLLLLDADGAKRKRLEHLSGSSPPAVIVFGDLHVLLQEQLLAEVCRHGETSRLLISTHPNMDLLNSTVNDCGLHAQICVPEEIDALEREIDRMVERATRIRRRYDQLRLALRDTQDDLRKLEQSLALRH